MVGCTACARTEQVHEEGACAPSQRVCITPTSAWMARCMSGKTGSIDQGHHWRKLHVRLGKRCSIKQSTGTRQPRCLGHENHHICSSFVTEDFDHLTKLKGHTSQGVRLPPRIQQSTRSGETQVSNPCVKSSRAARYCWLYSMAICC